MPRIIVTTDPLDRRDTAPDQSETAVLHAARVYAGQRTPHPPPAQRIERRAWAGNPAEDTQRTLSAH